MLKFSPFFFALFFAAPAHSREIDRTTALVNSDVILRSDMVSFRKNFALRKEIDPFVGVEELSSPPASDRDLLDYLIQERLALQKYPAQDDEVEEEINAVQKNNRIDREHLKAVLQSQGVNFDDYRKLMSVSVSKRKLVDKDLRSLAAVSDDDVKNYYYTAPSFANRRAEQKLVLTYNLQQLLVPNSDLAETARKRLRAGEDFDSVASDLSTRGAEISRLGSISEENMNARIRDAIQGLKVGEYTKAVPVDSGFMILRVLEVSAPKDPVFEHEKERIRNELFQKGLANQLKLWTERERASSFVHISSQNSAPTP
jgi:peptidyl-prolyl cis-trans isomerase SurA